MNQRVILLHGFEGESLISAVRAIKSVLPDPEGIAFASTTSVNMDWRVADLLDHVTEEHEAFRSSRGSTGNEGA